MLCQRFFPHEAVSEPALAWDLAEAAGDAAAVVVVLVVLVVNLEAPRCHLHQRHQDLPQCLVQYQHLHRHYQLEKKKNIKLITSPLSTITKRFASCHITNNNSTVGEKKQTDNRLALRTKLVSYMTGTHKKGVQQIIIQYYVKVLHNYQYHSCEEILEEQE